MAKIFKKPRWTTVVFYSVVLIVIVAFYFFMTNLMGKLTAHLENFQENHINSKYRQVFESYFADPDWGKLYDEAGMADTAFEGKEAFVAYMTQKVGDQELICFLESAGTDAKRCPVYLGNEEIGAFYMSSPAQPKPETDPWYYKIPFAESLVNKLKVQHWNYDGLTLVEPKRQLSVTVTTEGDRTVYVNGVALGEEYLISTTYTLAEQYLPEGLHGMRRQSFYADGFLVAPQVTAADKDGNPIELVELSPGVYSEVFTQQESEKEIEELVVDAAKVYCQYMIEATGSSSLRKYFDTAGQAYKDITSSEQWMQDYQTYRFGEATLSSFYRYSEDTVSIRLAMSLYVRRFDGSEKEYPVNTTFLMKKGDDGSYKVYATNNQELQKATTLVRLRFYSGGQLLESRMVDASANQLELPQVTAPEGKQFTGWYLATTAEDGSQTLSRIFLPKEGETSVYISAEKGLTAMDLQARFE